MAANLNKTKRRIASVKSTKKITKAMELVAQVKLKRFKDIMLKGENYVSEIDKLILTLFSSRSIEDEKSVYEMENEAEKDLVIVVTSNLGLCASYNNDIYKFLEKNIDRKSSVLLPVGLKGDEYLKKNGFDVDESFFDLNEKLNYMDVHRLSNYIDTLFTSKKFRSIQLIYTHYVNSIKFVPTLRKIYPIDITLLESKEVTYPPIYDPDIKTLIDSLIPIYTSSLLYQFIVESQVSEQASRRQAMENANDNADELIESLTLEYNKARQANITQEISEVTSASIGGK